jgi:hypothetical protein
MAAEGDADTEVVVGEGDAVEWEVSNSIFQI